MRQNKLIEKINSDQIKSDVPDFRPGDTIRVSVKVVEGKTERIQKFEGVVIKRHGAGIQATYTVRRIASGVGVERIFPVNSPRIANIEIIRRGDVRRAKLYYLRDRVGKSARIKEAKTHKKAKKTGK